MSSDRIDVGLLVRKWADKHGLPRWQRRRLERAVSLLLAVSGDSDEATLNRLIEREYRNVNMGPPAEGKRGA